MEICKRWQSFKKHWHASIVCAEISKLERKSCLIVYLKLNLFSLLQNGLFSFCKKSRKSKKKLDFIHKATTFTLITSAADLYTCLGNFSVDIIGLICISKNAHISLINLSVHQILFLSVTVSILNSIYLQSRLLSQLMQMQVVMKQLRKSTSKY